MNYTEKELRWFENMAVSGIGINDWYIYDGCNHYLHYDGAIRGSTSYNGVKTGIYSTKEAAENVLNKYRPQPKLTFKNLLPGDKFQWVGDRSNCQKVKIWKSSVSMEWVDGYVLNGLLDSCGAVNIVDDNRNNREVVRGHDVQPLNRR